MNKRKPPVDGTELLYDYHPLKNLEKSLISSQFPFSHNLGEPGETGENLYRALNCALIHIGAMYESYNCKPNGKWAWTTNETVYDTVSGSVTDRQYFIHFMTEEDRTYFLLLRANNE